MKTWISYYETTVGPKITIACVEVEVNQKWLGIVGLIGKRVSSLSLIFVAQGRTLTKQEFFFTFLNGRFDGKVNLPCFLSAGP